jgi:5-methylcytosine-specific restriction enzyme subunit McrC
MNNVLVVREAFDWLEARAGSSFTEEDMRELIAYMSQAYPRTTWIEMGYHRVRFINVVGTIRLSRVQIDIIPKLKLDAESGRTALLNMLAVCGHVPYRTGLSNSSMQKVRLDMLTWLADAYITELERELRKGVPAGYVLQEENSLRLKGRLMISAHIRMNSADKTRVYCAFDERTHSIPLNLVLYKAILVLKRRVKDLALRKRLQHLCFYFEELEIPGDVRSLLEHMQFDRQTGRLEPAFRIARLILSRMSVLQRGAQEESLSFLFEINSLYETYIGIVLQQMFTGSNTIVRLQHEQVKLLKNDDSGRDNIQLIPDMVLGKRHEDGREVWTTIIDTKWKTSNYQQDDIYQMYAYVTGYLDAAVPKGRGNSDHAELVTFSGQQ